MSSNSHVSCIDTILHTGRFVFPHGGFSAGDSADLPNLPQQSSSTAPRLTHQPALTTQHEPCSSDSEDECPGEAPSRIVEVEIHIEEAPDNSLTQRTALQQSADREQPVEHGAKCSEVTDDDQEQGSIQRAKLQQEQKNTQRPKLRREQNIHSASGVDEPDMRMEHPLMESRSAKKTVTKQVSIADGPPTVIPVQVPYSPSNSPATGRPQLKVSLPVKQSSSSQSPSFLKPLLSRSHRSTPPTTVLKVEARHGFQLKLKIPTEETDDTDYHLMHQRKEHTLF